VLVPPFGQSINGTRRWFRIGPLSFQPVELAKFSLVLYLASFLTKRREEIRTFWQGLFPILLVAGTMALLTFVQPDLGNSLALVVLTLVLAYLAGARVRHMAWIAAAALPLVALAVALKPYRWRRMLAFVNPWDDPQGAGFQIIQSFLALGSGGLFGRGLGESKQKLFYLPEPYTDFVFLIIGEELGLAGGICVIALKPYRWRRMLAFVNPWDDPQGAGFQIIQSFLALGSGGLFGRGLGESKQKLFYLPEPYTDFIFAILGEELGLIGATLVVGLFAVLIWRGLRVGLRAPDAFGSYLALGITVMLATQTLVNLGVVTGALPTKGLPLPFVSFGGSALLMTMFSAGVLLNISQHATGGPSWEETPGHV